MNYREFLANRTQLSNMGGFEPVDLPDHLFDFQRTLVEWAVRKGRGALFADCGLGKTPMALAWAEQVHRHTGNPVLFLTPLAVGQQIHIEAGRFGHDTELSRNGQVKAPITITNYEQLGKFDSTQFGGVVCDESSILKSFDGATQRAITEFMRRIQYRLLDTATAAPNDFVELGTSSEALGDLGYMDMLSRFFVNKDAKQSSRGTRMTRWDLADAKAVAQANLMSGWRLKGPAQQPFWRWVSSWARAMRKPSDYGYSDERHILPALIERSHMVDPVRVADGALFDTPATRFHEEREERRRTIAERCETAAEALSDADAGVAWCHLNDESALLTKLIPDAVELSGSDHPDSKEEKLIGFSTGQIRFLVTKPVIGAWGLNWQHANRMTYFPSHSYEQFYQSVRRMWRFGQTRPVIVDTITTPGGKRILENLQRKSAQADAMFTELVAHMNNAMRIAQSDRYTTELELPPWV